MILMIDLATTLPVCRARLVAARLAHSAAKKELNAVPIGTRQDLEDAERAAYAAVETARTAFEAAQKRQTPVGQVKPTTCCHAAKDVPGTWYQRETNCVLHGNRTVGTCD
jgi:hypothetical protein